MINGTKIRVVLNGGGGQGKTDYGVKGASFEASQSHKIIGFFDHDSVPSGSRLLQRGSEFTELERDAREHTIQRIYDQPEKGLGGIMWRFPLQDAIFAMDSIDRRANDKIKRHPDDKNPMPARPGEQIANLFLNGYLIDVYNMGELFVVPNGTTLIHTVEEAVTKFGIKVLRNNLTKALEVHEAKGGAHFDSIWIDTAGAVGPEVIVPAMCADDIFFVFNPNDKGLKGMVQSHETVVGAVRDSIPDSRNWPTIHPALPTMCAAFDEDENVMADTAFIEAHRADLMNRHGIRISDIRVPMSDMMFKYVSKTQYLPWQYAPFDDSVAYVKYYLDAEGITR